MHFLIIFTIPSLKNSYTYTFSFFIVNEIIRIIIHMMFTLKINETEQYAR